MLVLSRKMGEQIWIGDTIRLKVLEIRGGVVRLAFDAPRDVRIDREENLPADHPGRQQEG